MSQWDGCPISLFDMYMEVGEVRSVGTDSFPCIEVWISSGFARSFARPECAQIRRRSIWGILKQIRKLAGDRKVCLIFQCDDREDWGNDTENWAGAIYLLLKELRTLDSIACSMMFTRKTGDEIRRRISDSSFHRERDREDYIALFENLDILITAQANRHADPAARTVHFRSEETRDRFGWLLEEP